MMMTDTLDARLARVRERRTLVVPPRSVPAPSKHVDPIEPRVRWERVGADCYAVLLNDKLVGFVDVAGQVFVALAGCRYDRAVEVGQSVVFELAVTAVIDATAASGA
jgi:hypothetical protein